MGAKEIRKIPNAVLGRLYYVGSGGRVMSCLPGGKDKREEDMSPIVRKPKHMYYVKGGVLYERPIGKK